MNSTHITSNEFAVYPVKVPAWPLYLSTQWNKDVLLPSVEMKKILLIIN